MSLTNNFRSVAVADKQPWIIVASAPGEPGVLYSSRDGRRTWQLDETNYPVYTEFTSPRACYGSLASMGIF